MRLLFGTIIVTALAWGGAALAVDAGEEAAQSYRIITAGSTQSLKVGQKGLLSLSIEPMTAKVHVNAQAPLRIVLSASAGLKLEKEQLSHADAKAPGEVGRFAVPFTALAAGRQEAKAKLDFFICSEVWCVKQSRSVVIPVEVK